MGIGDKVPGVGQINIKSRCRISNEVPSSAVSLMQVVAKSRNVVSQWECARREESRSIS
jgi:hypothetical protein